MLNDSLSNEDFIKNISTFNCTIYDSYSSAIKIGNIVVLNMLIYNTATGQSEMSGIIIKVPYAPIKNIRLSTTAKIGYTATPLPCTLDLLTDGNIKIDSCNGEPSLIGWINLSICYVCNQ